MGREERRQNPLTTQHPTPTPTPHPQPRITLPLPQAYLKLRLLLPCARLLASGHKAPLVIVNAKLVAHWGSTTRGPHRSTHGRT